LASGTALPTSIVTVPVFGFGMSPRGPSTAAELPTRSSVRRCDGDVKVEEALLDLVARSAAPTDVGPGVLRLACLLALREDCDADVLADARAGA
jgi:hypothetical protein